jgi:HK97 family phage portal protein
MALCTDQPLIPKQVSDLRERWQEISKGEAYGGVAILAYGIKPVPLPAEKVIEAQIAEMSRVTVAEISRAYGVPLQLLNETSSLNYSTSVELQRAFANFSLIPLGQRVTDALSLALLSREERLGGMVIQYDFSSLLLGSGQELAEFASKLVNGGVVTVNEARDYLGLPDIPDGGILRTPVNTAPLGLWAEGKVGKPNGNGAALQ